MNEVATTQERYTMATKSSNLRLQADVRGDADYLIAAGWCKSRFGAALMRLQSEWDGAERLVPKKPTKRDIIKAAQVTIESSLKVVKDKKKRIYVRSITSDSMEQARKRLEKTYLSQMGRAIAPLKTLRAAGLHLSLKLAMEGDDIEGLPARILLYWLDPRCVVCKGTGIQAESERGCGKCREHPGFSSVPGGMIGRAAVDYIEDCIERARDEIRKPCMS